jgi:outer membrane protein OmpA-like peptidoglycan-associated protein
MYGALFFVAGVLLWSQKGDVADSPERPRAETVIPPVPTSRPETVAVHASSPAHVEEPKQKEPITPAQSPPAEKPRDVALRTNLALDSGLARKETFLDLHATQPASESPRFILDGIQFPKIVFEPGSADLTNQSKAALQTLAAELKRRQELKIEIQAYVASLGPEANNFALTQTRASTIRDFLVVKGVAASRLSAQGFGSPSSSDSPIAFVVRR